MRQIVSLCLLCLMSEEIRETDSVTMSTRSDVRKKYMRQIVLLRHSLWCQKRYVRQIVSLCHFVWCPAEKKHLHVLFKSASIHLLMCVHMCVCVCACACVCVRVCVCDCVIHRCFFKHNEHFPWFLRPWFLSVLVLMLHYIFQLTADLSKSCTTAYHFGLRSDKKLILLLLLSWTFHGQGLASLKMYKLMEAIWLATMSCLSCCVLW